MSSQSAFSRFSKVILVTVFLVILAGGVVRMTQSGMGCPDWPKCFGRWIPPTSEEQLPINYKQMYAFKYVDTSFNPYHTWIEYINRTLGALLGLLFVVQFIWSFVFFKSNRKIVWLSFALLLLTGLQGWLGSKVVEANLEAVKVTTHMLVALVIAALAITIVHLSSLNKSFADNKKLKILSAVTIGLLIIQIVLGTQVREQIDHISAGFNFAQRELWIGKLNYIFYIHRTFSIVIAGVCLYLFFQYNKYYTLQATSWLILICVLLNILLGITMAYFNVPSIAQPLHLLLSSILITAVYYSWLSTV
ncbi:MAG: COX15/CtaA family protein [Ginsengibacter sp.]